MKNIQFIRGMSVDDLAELLLHEQPIPDMFDESEHASYVQWVTYWVTPDRLIFIDRDDAKHHVVNWLHSQHTDDWLGLEEQEL